jgi:hypothetical protein
MVDLRLKTMQEPREPDIWLLGAIGPRMVYSTNLDAARRACDRRMVTFAHTVSESVELLWNEQHWTLAALPVNSTRDQWDEGLKAVRQFSDLLRVLPPSGDSAPSPVAAPPRPSRPVGTPASAAAEPPPATQARLASPAAQPVSHPYP